jgi:hypothetical protein
MKKWSPADEEKEKDALSGVLPEGTGDEVGDEESSSES